LATSFQTSDHLWTIKVVSRGFTIAKSSGWLWFLDPSTIERVVVDNGVISSSMVLVRLEIPHRVEGTLPVNFDNVRTHVVLLGSTIHALAIEV